MKLQPAGTAGDHPLQFARSLLAIERVDGADREKEPVVPLGQRQDTIVEQTGHLHVVPRCHHQRCGPLDAEPVDTLQVRLGRGQPGLPEPLTLVNHV